MGNTLDLLTGKDCTVNGCWLGVVNGVSISYEKDHLEVTLKVMVDDDGLDRLKEYSVIERIMGSNNEGDDNETDSRNKGTHKTGQDLSQEPADQHWHQGKGHE